MPMNIEDAQCALQDCLNQGHANCKASDVLLQFGVHVVV
jgi:hypothetical protein